MATKPKTVTTTTPFDYDKWFANEPTLQAALRQIEQARLGQGATLVGGEQQLFGRLGEAPDLSDPRYANLPPALRQALASAISSPDLQAAISAGNQAGTSALAQLNQKYRLGLNTAQSQVAGSGFLRSGAYGQEANKALRGLTLGQYDTRLAASDALNELQGSYVSGMDTLRGEASDAVTAAQKRASDLIGLGQIGPTTTTRTVANPYMSGATIGPGAPVPPRPATSGATIGPAAPVPTTPIPPAPTVPKPKAAPYKPPAMGFRALR